MYNYIYNIYINFVCLKDGWGLGSKFISGDSRDVDIYTVTHYTNLNFKVSVIGSLSLL